MKKKLLSLVLLFVCLLSFADTYQILEVSPSPIKIGGKNLKKNDTYNSKSVIEWSDTKQFMRVQNLSKPNDKPRKFYAETFSRRNSKSIDDYYIKIGQTASRFLGNFEAGNNKSDFPEKRIAFVVGNSEYKYSMFLHNSVGDAILVKDKLKELGFDVMTCYDGSLEEMSGALRAFCNRAKDDKYDVALFYYAGHAVQSNDKGVLYLLPIDIKEDLHIVKNNCFSALNVRDDMLETGCRSIMFFDACRTNADVRRLGAANFSMDPAGAFVAFSTANGDTAYDKFGDSANSPFATSFAKNIGIPGLSISSVMDNITHDVYQYTKQTQRPTYNNGLGLFLLSPHNSKIKNTPHILIDKNTDSLNSKSYEDYTVNGVTFRMIKVGGGTFTLGGTSEMKDKWAIDEEERNVKMNDFYIGECEVTQELWNAIMTWNPSNFRGKNYPVENISWDDIQIFIEKLNSITQRDFNLPTEDEWEYAARGGQASHHTKYAGSNDLYDVAWIGENSGNKTHSVKTKKPNELGLYDMNGNVWEMCQTLYSSGWRSKRGGAFVNSTTSGVFPLSSRHWIDTESTFGSVGFRLVLYK